MSLDYSIASIMTRLTDWSGFPKYQLERRVDIFLTPFIERFIGDRLEGTAKFVAPEFPLLAKLKGSSARRTGRDLGLRTINVDYLLHLARTPAHRSAWVFLELKTDAGSYRAGQNHAYKLARRLGMKRLLGHIGRIRAASKKHRSKYDLLLERMREFDPHTDRIELVYLGPPPRDGIPRAALTTNPTHHFDLLEFAEERFDMTVPDHGALWPYLRDFLRSLQTTRHASRAA